MRLVLVFFALVALFATAPLAHALDDVLLDDGEVLQGEVLAVEADGVRVRFRAAGGGTAELLIKEHDLDPHYFYEARSRAVGEDAEAHLELGLWAAEAGLWMRARTSLRKAIRLNKKLALKIEATRFQDIRDEIAAQILDRARAYMKAGRSDRAEAKLKALLARMADTPSGAYAADLIDEAQKLSAAAAAKAELEGKARMAAEARKAAEARDALLQPARKQIAKSERLEADGLKEDGSTAALDLLEKALDRAREAGKLLDEVAQDHAEDEDLRAEIGILRQRLRRHQIELHIHRADIYADRPSMPAARKALAKAAELDPESVRVERARKRLDEREEEERWEIRTRRDRAANGGRFRGRRGGRLPLGR